MKTIILMRNVMIKGEPKVPGDAVTLEDGPAKYLVNIGKAKWPEEEEKAKKQTGKKETADSKGAAGSEKR